MPFQFSDQHIEEFHMLGYTVFGKILPPSLISDLRRVSHIARKIARERGGARVLRASGVFLVLAAGSTLKSTKTMPIHFFRDEIHKML